MRLLCLSLALAATLGLAACERAPVRFSSVDITGAAYARDFALTDPRGQRRSLADYRGKLVVVFFGFTHCPDVCPTTLATLAEVKGKLGADGDKLQVVFITVDPERDTPQLLAQYVPAFDPSFVGLWGTPDEIAATAREFKVFYQKVPGRTPTAYTMDHSTGRYAFDAQGRLRLFVKHEQSVDSIVADLRQLLR